MKFKEWWDNRSELIGFICGILIGAILFYVGTLVWVQEEKDAGGIKIDNAYISSVTEKERKVNDLYVTTLINFADVCGNNSKVLRTNDFKNRVNGVTLYCKNDNSTFTFWYSDKWRYEQYGKK